MDLEYKLKKLLKSSTLKVTNYKNISTKETLSAFRSKYPKDTIITAFSSNPGSGIFPLVSVPIDINQTHHKIFLCEVAVGKSLFANKFYAEKFPIPPDFDSYIVSETDENLKTEKKNWELKFKSINKETDLEFNSNDGIIDENVDIKKYSYLIKETQRICPIFEIEFDYDKKLEDGKKNKCEMCKKESSIMFCIAERAPLCKKCDQIIHNNELTMRHKRYYFSEIGKKKFMMCPFHSEVIVDFYCIKCNSPVCTTCRISGNHINTTHKLISYFDACEYLRKKIKNVRFSEISIEEMKNDMFEFKSNVDYVKKKIDEEYKKAIRELRMISMRQSQIYNAEILKYLKYREEVKLIKNFLLNVDDVNVVRDFKIIEGEKKLSCVMENFYKSVRMALSGELKVEKKGINLKNEENK